jgi:5-methylcytosine-specific restriction endonuclease McrA
MKICTRCGEEKGLDLFSPNKMGKMGRYSICQSCQNTARRERYRRDRDRYRRFGREYRRRLLKKNPQVAGLDYALQRTPCSEFELFKGRSRKEVIGETKFDYVLSRLLTAKTGIPHEVDHIKPLCAGGVHRHWNLSVMPMSSNREKGGYWDQVDDQLADEDIERLDQEAINFNPSVIEGATQ